MGRREGRPAAAPVSTYRVQVTEELDLPAVADLLPQLHALGADWVYLSPILASEPGSEHGYDVVAHDHVDEPRGGAEGLARLSAEARRLGMGVLVDVVPNHVGVATPAEDPWWWDVLQHGRTSEHAPAFDVDWAAGHGRIRIPVVGDDDQLPEGGPIAHLEVADGELHYHDHRFPLAPGSADDLGRPLPGGGVVDAQVVHERQHYELVNWHVADDGLNYRRFFAVNSLAALRVEDPEVFADTHVEIGRWFREGLVDGLRVDHPDGLRDPEGYLDDLAGLTGDSYVLVEKILEPGEDLPAHWACEGTTGYDVLGVVERVLVDPAGEEPLTALDAELREATGGRPVRSAEEWEQLVHDLKREVTDTILHSEVLRVTRELRRALRRSGGVEAATEVTFDEAADAVAELLACFPVYRSYLPHGREHLDEAEARARSHRPDLAAPLDVVLPVLRDPAQPPAQRFQQTSGMVMAKGVEDRAFYRWARLTSLTEVGGDPAHWSLDAADFHAAMARRQHEWPQAMTTTSTHDTKRGEDVRARIDVLAEVPDLWWSTLARLQELAPVPDAGFANLLWQAAFGAWPLDRDRLHAYADKAAREAGERTTWTEPDEAFESAVHAAIDAAYDDPRVRELLDDLATRLAGAGWSNSLSAKLLALTVPGVPDVYQGSELWEQSLVDPDNRRWVDQEQRGRILAEVRAGAVPPLTGDLDDEGAAKLRVVHGALALRRDRPELFGSYAPLAAEGDAADHCLAFDRGGAVAVATRLPVRLRALGGWGSTRLRLPAGRWVDVLTGREVEEREAEEGVLLADLLGTYPVALLAPAD